MKTQRNLWPFGIISAFVLFTLGTAVLVVLSVTSNTDLVSSDYYEQEIRYQSQLDRLSRAQSLPAKATATYDEARRVIQIALPREHAGARGDVHLYRPSTAGLDQRVELQLNAGGLQTLDATSLRPGLWKVKVVWSISGQDYAIEKVVVVGAKNS